MLGCKVRAKQHWHGQWHPAQEVSPENALPEYPRPTMVRQRWQNFNGLWDYAITVHADEQMP